MGELGEELAARFGALSDVFAAWRTPEAARAVLESLLAGDHETFHRLLPAGFDGPGPDPVDPPDPKVPRGPTFCRLVVEVVEKLVPSREVPCSRLRTDLTPAEKTRYAAIVIWCWKNGCLPALESNGLTEVGPCKGIVIPPGEFLTLLQSEGLVEDCTCLVDGGIQAQLTPPEHMCA